MSGKEYNVWAPRSQASYAADKMKANRLTKAEAEKIAHDDFKQMLPDGLGSKDNFLFAAKDESQKIIGFIWFCVRGAEGNRRAFVCDVIVEENYRGKGFGKKIMLLAEKEAQSQGLRRIGLHVFGFNETAIHLYKSLGYTTTDLTMEKDLFS